MYDDSLNDLFDIKISVVLYKIINNSKNITSTNLILGILLNHLYHS